MGLGFKTDQSASQEKAVTRSEFTFLTDIEANALYAILSEIKNELITIHRISIMYKDSDQVAWLAEGVNGKGKDALPWCVCDFPGHQWNFRNFVCIGRGYGYSKERCDTIRSLFFDACEKEGRTYKEYVWCQT